ncbi:rod shape-determining protein MreD [Thermanaeromonas sp. C210]|nr:rod shape-determining protein MreD [Thermanaeromonas sp. C210]
MGALILEATLMEFFKIAGVKPDLLLILLLFYALETGAGRGAVVGLLYGLMEDLYVGRLLGFNALIKMLLGYLLGWGRDRLNVDNPWVPVSLAWGASLAAGVMFLLLCPLGGMDYPWSAALTTVILPASIYNASLAFVGQGLSRRRAEWVARKRNHGSLT